MKILKIYGTQVKENEEKEWNTLMESLDEIKFR